MQMEMKNAPDENVRSSVQSATAEEWMEWGIWYRYSLVRARESLKEISHFGCRKSAVGEIGLPPVDRPAGRKTFRVMISECVPRGQKFLLPLPVGLPPAEDHDNYEGWEGVEGRKIQ